MGSVKPITSDTKNCVSRPAPVDPRRQEVYRRGKRINWYRCSVPREQLKKMNQRSDALGFAQTLGFLAILTLTSGTAIYSSLNWAWYITAALVILNGHIWHFVGNGFHELVHDSVFRTQRFNRLFLRIFAFLGWSNHHTFWASHTEHHKYTLHPPDDREVELPRDFDLRGIWKWGIVNLTFVPTHLHMQIRNAFGYVDPDGSWIAHLFPPNATQRRRARLKWDRILLVGHLAIVIVAISQGLWVVPLVITFPKIFGGWLKRLCNEAQHIGLTDNVPDFRLCCRTIYLNPALQFLYWHMNYHTEHHMYASVPCYRLGRLHRMIQHDMPHCTKGLRDTWNQIRKILQEQKQNSEYQFTPEVPTATSSHVRAAVSETV